MYIPGKNEKFIIKGYSVIKKTDEGMYTISALYGRKTVNSQRQLMVP